MDDYITVRRQFVLDAINIGLSGYISDDDKLTLEGMGIAVSEIPTTDLSGFCDRFWRGAYNRGYEWCKQDAIDAIENIRVLDGYTGKIAFLDKIRDLHTAQPERMKGEWIEMGTNTDGTHNIKCSKCGEGYKTRGHAMSFNTKKRYKYCPNCGARMEGESDE